MGSEGNKWVDMVADEASEGPIESGRLLTREEAITLAAQVLYMDAPFLTDGGGRLTEDETETRIELNFVIRHTDELLTAQVAELDGIIQEHKDAINSLNDRRVTLNDRRNKGT